MRFIPKAAPRHSPSAARNLGAAAIALAALGAWQATVGAAVIASGPSGPAASAGSSATASNTYNYTAQGTLDYAYYGYGTSKFDHSASVATSLFSLPTLVGSVTSGTGGDAKSLVTTTNGVSNTGTAENVTNAPSFTYGNAAGTEVAGEGIAFTYTLPTITSTVNVYAVDYSGSGSPSVTLSVIDTSTSTTIYTSTAALPTSPLSDANHGYGLYPITLTGTPGSVVQFQIVNNTASGNAGFQGATATPEPAGLGLLAIGGAGLLRRRKRGNRSEPRP